MESSQLVSLVKKICPSPLNFVPCSRGQFSIKQEIWERGKEVPVISMRTSILTGLPTFSFFTEGPIRVHRLVKRRDGLVTSDVPEEMITQYMSFKNVHGHVLVGGLGLGMAAVMIANIPKVTKVTVVEIEQDVIDLVISQLPKTKAPIEIVCADLFKLMLNDEIEFDSAYIDIWSGTGENTWKDYVVPIRIALRQTHGLLAKDIGCWKEDEMKGQICNLVTHIAGKKPDTTLLRYIDHWQPAWAFWKGLQKAKPRHVESFIRFYLEDIGSDKWMRIFPWESWMKCHA